MRLHPGASEQCQPPGGHGAGEQRFFCYPHSPGLGANMPHVLYDLISRLKPSE